MDAPVILFASSPAIPRRYSTLAQKRRSTPLCDLALGALPGNEPGGPEADRRAARPTCWVQYGDNGVQEIGDGIYSNPSIGSAGQVV